MAHIKIKKIKSIYLDFKNIGICLKLFPIQIRETNKLIMVMPFANKLSSPIILKGKPVRVIKRGVSPAIKNLSSFPICDLSIK
jgi:hypothetical protein